MSVFNKPDLQSLQEKPKKTYKNSWHHSDRGQSILDRFLKQINDFHSMDSKKDLEIEEILLKQHQFEVDQLRNPPDVPKLVRFSPSGSSKCSRELYFSKVHPEEKDSSEVYPYRKRWQLNATAAHERIQRDILYSSKMVSNSHFSPYFLPNGLPAWERAILRFKEINHRGERFGIYGMGDGILKTNDSDQIYGFEYKTKNTIGGVGDFKLRSPEIYHLSQIYSYFILFENLEGYILLYESMSKDAWMKESLAKQDLKAFFVEPDKEKQDLVLDKFASVAKAIREEIVPSKEEDKCIFCPFKTKCREVG